MNELNQQEEDHEPSLRIEKLENDTIWIFRINRAKVKNAVDGPTAIKLFKGIQEFSLDKKSKVGILYGENGTFCAGADLHAFNNPIVTQGIAPMGPSRLMISKPMIAAVSGYAVAGGLELSLICDLRVCETDSCFGVFCRRWGVPLIDGGTVRLPRLIGQGRALDLILTGRPVYADEALSMGLVNRIVAKGTVLQESLNLAQEIASFPFSCVLSDRESCMKQWDLPLSTALEQEFSLGVGVLRDNESTKFSKERKGRGGSKL